MQDYQGIFQEYANLKNTYLLQESSLSTIASHAKLIKTQINAITTSFSTFYIPKEQLPLFKPFQSMNSTLLNETFLLINQINDELLFPIEEFKQNIEEISTYNLSTFHQMCKSILSGKQSLLKTQDSYHKACSKSKEIETLINNANNHKQSDIDSLIKAKTIEDKQVKMYKSEIDKFNKSLVNANKTYLEIKSNLKANNDTNYSFIKELLIKYYNIITKINIIPNLLLNAINEIINSISVDILNIREEKIEQEQRFLLEQFMLYNNQNISKNIISDFIEINSFEDFMKDYIKTSLSSNQPKDKEIEYKNKVLHIKKLLLRNESQLTNEEVDYITNYFNVNNNENHLEALLYFKKWFFGLDYINVCIINYQNFEILCTVIKHVFIKINEKQISNEKDMELFLLGNKAVIEISEKINCYCSYKNYYIYMCSLLSDKNNTFKSETFWLALMRDIIINDINSFINTDLSKIKEKNYSTWLNNYQRKDNISSSMNISNLNTTGTNDFVKNKSKSIFPSSIFQNVKNVLSLSSSKGNKDNVSMNSLPIEDKYLNDNNDDYILELNSFVQDIEGYDKLNTVQKKILNAYAKQKLHDVIKEYIIHMVNFNVNKTTIETLFNYFTLDLTILQQHAKYFFSLIFIQEHSRKKMNNLKSEFKRNIYYNKNNIDNNLIIILSNVIPFIGDFSSLANFLFIKKSLTLKIHQLLIREYMLSPNYSYQKLLTSWSKKLKLDSIKSDPAFNYSSLKENFNPNLMKQKIKETIDLDVLRTSFLTNVKENREKLSLILYLTSNIFSNINYYQGMNFTVSFLLQLLNFNESETYYHMVGLMYNTKYISLYPNELQLLKEYFFICEKVLEIFYPEIYDKIITSKLNAHFFLPPWFLTLFTNVFLMFNKENIPKSIMLIIDNFIYKGYDSILLTGIALINYHRDYIIVLDQEECFEFIINKLNHSELFKNENFDKFVFHLNLVSQMITQDILLNIKGLYEHECSTN